VIVGNKNPHGGQDQNEQTSSAILGKAEPGRDIFAEAQEKDIKSDSFVFKKPDPESAREEKEISSVIIGASTTAKEAISEASSEASSESHTSVAASEETTETSAAAADSSSSKQDVSAKSESAVVAPAAEAGPLGEAEAEAQKAAKELFPEAV
jgi:dolichyl-phosphate-mannose-protein mannosyltransferase